MAVPPQKFSYWLQSTHTRVRTKTAHAIHPDTLTVEARRKLHHTRTCWYIILLFSLFFFLSFFLSRLLAGVPFCEQLHFRKVLTPPWLFLSLSLCLSLHPPFPAQSKFSIPPGLVVPPPLRELFVLKIIYIYDFFTTVKSTTFSLLLSFIWFGLSFLFPVVVVVVFFFGSRAPVGKVVHLGSGVFLQLMTVQAQRGDVDTCNQHL